MRIDSTTSLRLRNPYASSLRHQAHALRRLADELEGLAVHRLVPDGPPAVAPSPLAGALLEHNVQQIHLAAEHLRWTAWRLAGKADELDSAGRR